MRTRMLRLLAFALSTGVIAILAINAALAWTYTARLTHPLCQPPIPLGVNNTNPQEILLTTAGGISLRAWYYPTRNGAAVLALGGLDGSLGSSLPAVGFLLQAGYGVLQIDGRACGTPPSPVTLGGKEIQEVEAAIHFIRSTGEVEKIGVYGYSMGGVTAIRSAARNSEILAVVAEGGYFNLGDDFIEPDMPKSFLRSLFLQLVATTFWLQSGVNPWQISPIDDLALLSPRPVLLIYGEHEAASGRALAQFNAAREPKSLWIVPGGSHGQNYQLAPGEYERRVLEIFDLALQKHPLIH